MEAILKVQTQLSKSDNSNVAKGSRSRVKTLAKKLNPQTVESGTQCLMEVDSGPESFEQDKQNGGSDSRNFNNKTQSLDISY